MIRLTPQRRFHVSNRAAVLAGLILVLTSFTGLSSNQGSDQHYADNANVAVSQAAENSSAKAPGKRKLSLFLIGRG